MGQPPCQTAWENAHHSLSVDLDIEGGGSTGYAAFITRLRSYFDSADKACVARRMHALGPI